MEENAEKQGENKPSANPGRKWGRILLGLLAGAFVGGLYWNFIGCNGGSCPITANPVNTVVLFSLMGGWLVYK